MQYTQLGSTGLVVSRLAFGAVTFTKGNKDLGAIYKVGAQLAEELVARSLDAGMNFFDTADGYANGESETLLGLTVWSPLAGGFLSGKYTRQNLSDPNNRVAGFDFFRFDTPLAPVYPNWFNANLMDQPVAQALARTTARQ
jgi:aryl-alcohol dehydrogenase-like predicted oxidoreductase